MLEVSKNLKDLRKERGLSQEKVAKIIHVSQVAYSRYENDEREIPIALLCKLADFYNVSLDYLAGRED